METPSFEPAALRSLKVNLFCLKKINRFNCSFLLTFNSANSWRFQWKLQYFGLYFFLNLKKLHPPIFQVFLLWSEWPYLFSHSVLFRNRQWYLNQHVFFLWTFPKNNKASRIHSQQHRLGMLHQACQMFCICSQNGQLPKICSDNELKRT